jgi:hypothetical protein
LKNLTGHNIIDLTAHYLAVLFYKGGQNALIQNNAQTQQGENGV